jgi:hypothetical protein
VISTYDEDHSRKKGYPKTRAGIHTGHRCGCKLLATFCGSYVKVLAFNSKLLQEVVHFHINESLCALNFIPRDTKCA